MGMNIDFTSVVTECLQEIAEELRFFLRNLVQSERMKDAAEYCDNPEEAAQFEEEVRATDVEITVEGQSLAVSVVTSGSLYDKVTTEGKPESYSGGQGGVVTLPDGTQVSSEVNPNLWGQPVPDSAEPPSVWKENFLTMARSLVPQKVQERFKEIFGPKAAPLIANGLAASLGGVT